MWGPPEACQWCSTSCRALRLSYRSWGQVGTEGQAHSSHPGGAAGPTLQRMWRLREAWGLPKVTQFMKDKMRSGIPHLWSNEPLDLIEGQLQAAWLVAQEGFGRG